MTLQQICDLPVPSICADDAVLFLWATNPKLKEAFEVIEAWDFEYLTNMVWMKDRIGTGYYFRGQHELLLVGKRGKMPVPGESDRPPSVLHSPRRKHSQKPHEVYIIIEALYPSQKFLELFARSKRAGWTSWGDEIPQCILKRNLRLKTKAKK